jgi:hypothetical protein
VSNSNRRQFLKGALTALVQAAGTVTLASAAVAQSQEKEKRPNEGEAPAGDLQQRADELAETAGPATVDARAAASRRAGGWSNIPPWGNGGWGNGGWRNIPPWGNGGGTSGWSNIPPWGNGGWGNGGWRNW